MADQRIEKLADVLVNYSVGVKKDDKVLIQGSTLAEPLIKAAYAQVLKAGGHPEIKASLPGVGELLYKHASDEQLQYVSPIWDLVVDTYDGMISFLSTDNKHALTNVNPEKTVLAQRAQGELFKRMMARSSTGELRWVGALYPLASFAQDAHMGTLEYEDFVYNASLPDFDDPIGYWKNFSAWQQKVVDWLKGKERIRVVGPGTELELSFKDRPFINCDGANNMPDGEIFTSPIEDSVEGHVSFSYPSNYMGREVAGIQLWFEKGKVVKSTADKNEEFLSKTLDTDEGARMLGEFAIGTNKAITKFTGETLFDEKINGTCHMALGASIPESLGVNESAIHWDLVCDLRDGGEIYVDDVLFHANGEFQVDFS